MNPTLSSLALGGLALVFASSLSAQTLVQYTFTQNNTGSSRNPVVAGVNAETFAFANGAGVTITSSSIGNPDPRSYIVTANHVDEAISPASSDWLGFTISATEGHELNLSHLGFFYAYTNTQGVISSSATFDVRSSVDDYATSLFSNTLSVVNSTSPVWSQASIGLSATAYQGLETISFRIFLGDDGVGGTNTQLRLDTVTLSGVSTAPVPEPSAAAALLGFAGLGFAASRRRARSA